MVHQTNADYYNINFLGKSMHLLNKYKETNAVFNAEKFIKHLTTDVIPEEAFWQIFQKNALSQSEEQRLL